MKTSGCPMLSWHAHPRHTGGNPAWGSHVAQHENLGVPDALLARAPEAHGGEPCLGVARGARARQLAALPCRHDVHERPLHLPQLGGGDGARQSPAPILHHRGVANGDPARGAGRGGEVRGPVRALPAPHVRLGHGLEGAAQSHGMHAGLPRNELLRPERCRNQPVQGGASTPRLKYAATTSTHANAMPPTTAPTTAAAPPRLAAG
eukprot:CAMPEP_0172039966 /NCGR_PEP_ID=MMETSP1041-20130122/24222_1 /TAXON_ID=464988 /ORGANISM="Hemiselmis andersenii, Strain CCMP439" /LENGTH=205 /DNA_ID=CAMNT_0012697783 /DNA_START=33 /DNA_END=647 /DNA_ORIENTATION=-